LRKNETREPVRLEFGCSLREIHEDHDKESDHRVSRFVPWQDDIAIWYVGADTRPRTIATLAHVGCHQDRSVGLDLSLGQQLGLVGILLVTSKGGAGVAGSAIVVRVSTLAATGTVPVAA
jgi:hypothetical protein